MSRLYWKSPWSSRQFATIIFWSRLFLTKMYLSLPVLLMMSAFFTNTWAIWTKSSFCQSSIFIFLQFGLGRIKHLRGTGPSQGCRAPMGPHSLCMKLISHLYLSTACLINQLIFLSLFLISFPFFSSFFLFFHLSFVLFLVILGSIFQVRGPPRRGALGPMGP